MTRPPAFRIVPVNPVPLFLFFGHGDYVIARDAAEASVLWMDHFGEISYAKDFEKIPEDERVEIWFDGDFVIAEQRTVRDGHGWIKAPTAQMLIEQLGPGYLASTTED